MPDVAPLAACLKINDLDRRSRAEELDEFSSLELSDLHNHPMRGKFDGCGYPCVRIDQRQETCAQSNCDGRTTLVRYEMLRAVQRAALRTRTTDSQITRFFYDNAILLLGEVRRDLHCSLASPVLSATKEAP